MLVCIFFFFQAEDGIRDFHVTGVQTCALPISLNERPKSTSRLHEPLPCTPPVSRRGRPRRPMSNGTSPLMPWPILNVTRKSLIRFEVTPWPLAQTVAELPHSGVTTTSSSVAAPVGSTPFVSSRRSAPVPPPSSLSLSKMNCWVTFERSYASTSPSPSWSAALRICCASVEKGRTTLLLKEIGRAHV